LLGVEWMQRRVDLHRWSEQREIANPDRTHVQHDAVEIEEDPLAELDVRTVITIERRLHPDGVATCREQVGEQAASLRVVRFPGGIEPLA
jgi:hypothetical protein